MTRIILLLGFSVLLRAQTQAVLGTVTEFKVHSLEVGVKPDEGSLKFLRFGPATQVVQVPPGERDLSKAQPAAITDIRRGDRVLVSLVKGEADARRIVVISADDIAKRNEAERVDWLKRGLSGIVTAKGEKTVTIEIRSPIGVGTSTVAIGPKTKLRRYAPDSIRFSDAEPSTPDAIAIGDQLRTRGTRSEDGVLMAEDVVFGTFLTRLGPITAIDAEHRRFTMQDQTSKRTLTIKIAADSRLKRIMERQPDNRDQHNAPPPTPGAFSVAAVIDSLPAGKFEDLKVGGSVILTSTRGTANDEATAILLLVNADALIAIAKSTSGDSSMSAAEAVGRMHGGMLSGPSGLSLPGMLP